MGEPFCIRGRFLDEMMPWLLTALLQTDLARINQDERPYRYTSLKGMSNQEIAVYMGEGKSALELLSIFGPPTREPDGSWTLPPKKAALALADMNLTAEHRKAYQLSVDDADGRTPPESCSIVFASASSRCYNAIDWHYFLRCDPKGSYLAYAQTRKPGVVFFNVVEAGTDYDLRWCELTHDEARHVAHTIWWLNRVRSKGTAEGGRGGLNPVVMMFSTADGHGTLELTAERDQISLEGTMWFGCIAGRWSGDYDNAVFLNFAGHLLTSAFPARLGKRWIGIEHERHWGLRSEATALSKEQLDHLGKTALKLVDMFVPDESRVSPEIAQAAASAAGDLVLKHLDPALERIEKQLPQLTSRTARENKGMRSLKDALSLARLKLSISENEDELSRWARMGGENSVWALHRLKDRRRFE